MLVLAPGLARILAEAIHYNTGPNSRVFHRLRLYNGTAVGNKVSGDGGEWRYYTDATTHRHQNATLGTGAAVKVNSSGNWAGDNATVRLNYGIDTGTNAAVTAAARIVFDPVAATWNDIKFVSFEICRNNTATLLPSPAATLPYQTGDPPTTVDRDETTNLDGGANTNSGNTYWRELFRFTIPGNGDGTAVDVLPGEKIRLAGLYVRCYAGSPSASFRACTITTGQSFTSSQANALVSGTQYYAEIDTSGFVQPAGVRVPIQFYKVGDRLYYSGPVVFGNYPELSGVVDLNIYTVASGGSPVYSKTITSINLNAGDVPFLDESALSQYFTIVG
jgi:hypothetical protein